MRRAIEAGFWLIIAIRTIALIVLPTVVDEPPLALVAARPTAEVLLFAAAGASATRFTLIALCAIASRVALDLAMYSVAHRYGTGLIGRLLSERGVKAVDRLKRPAARRTLVALCVVASSTPVVLAAGITGLRLRTFAIASTTGTVLIVLTYMTAGRTFQTPVAVVAEWIGDHQMWTAAGLAAAVAAFTLMQRRRGGTDRPDE